jgi:hypothetical protein
MKFELNYLINHVKKSIEDSDNRVSKLSNDILNMEGMSGKKTRHLYNNICSLPGANYLEIGTWKGSSFVSALYGNDINSIAVDNWSEFNGPKNEFIKNVELFCPNTKYNFIEKDCFEIKKEDILNIYDSVDIYLFDGNHSYESQKKAITYYKNFFSSYIIIIIDDFRSDTPNWANVKKGTIDGIEESGLIIHFQREIITYQESNGADEYWNGVGIFVCEVK